MFFLFTQLLFTQFFSILSVTDNICTWFARGATVTGPRQQDKPIISKGELTRPWQERQSEAGEIIHNGSRKTTSSGCSIDKDSIRQNFYRDKNMFVATSLLWSRRKTSFVATNTYLSRQTCVCVAAPANDRCQCRGIECRVCWLRPKGGAVCVTGMSTLKIVRQRRNILAKGCVIS